MVKLREYRLGDIVTLINGRAYLMPELQDRGKYRIVRVGNFTGKDEWFYSDMELEPEKYCNEGDLLFKWACTFGPEIWHGEKCIYHYHIWKVIPDGNIIDKMFLFYLLRFMTPLWMRATNGSTMVHITKEVMENHKVWIPEDVAEQRGIARILGEIDTKIANNNAICEDLEAMAKLLYDYWFVQFDFPDEDGRPYKSSGGKMVWNDELKQEIPDGWQVLQLGEIAHYSSEKTDVSTLSSDNYIGNDNLLDDMQGRRGSDYVPVEGFATRYRFGDTLVGNIRPYFKKIWLADGDGGSSADVLVVVPNERDEYCFVFASLSRDDFFSYDLAGAKGSKMPRGDKEHIMRYPIVYCEEAICEFTDVVSKWYELRAEIYYENQDLESLRDFLLPMLMNGQVKVAS